ncbi:MAG TPA: PEP/pyruvate-binding domain-containing protein [Candidatus Acidoferrales bacterium]|nr:PEP/pyruvate-binding domain-containing protein [Candidatus Acidoferrales bacterium]
MTVTKTAERPAGTGVFTLPLGAVSLKDLSRVGGKAAHLGAMIAAGLPVPSGFVVTAKAWQRFLQSDPHLGDLLRRLEDCELQNPAALRSAADDIRTQLHAAPVPAEVADAIAAVLARESGHVWAVRSSATVEDQPEASFAGQHDTFLNVCGSDAVVTAVKQCWLSLFTERAICYRRQKSIPSGHAQMGVIVQTQIHVEAAGVMFTVDPTGRAAGGMVIEAASGLGESVVQGRVAPDRWVVSRSPLRLLRYEAGEQRVRAVADEHGMSVEALPAQGASARVMDEPTAIRLARLALEAEQVLGGPLDIEWGLCGREIWLLQARAVTTSPPKPQSRFDDRQVWTNANAGEALPEVVTPMTWSLLRQLVADLFDALLRCGGMRMECDQVFGLIAGRAYFNLNAMYALGRQVPGARDGDIVKLFGGQQEAVLAQAGFKIADADLPDIQISRWRAAAHLLAALPRFLFNSTQRGQTVVANLGRLNGELSRTGLELLTDGELAAAIQAAFVPETFLKIRAFEAIGISVLYYVLLFRLCERWFGPEGSAIANRLLAGVGGLDDAEAGHEIWRLAEEVVHDAELKSSLQTGVDFAALASRLRSSPRGPVFLDRWAAFMSQHGHHARGEVELYNPRWSECSDLVLNWMRGCVQAIEAGHPSPDERRAALAAERALIERDCLGRLGNPVKRALFRLILRRAQDGGRLRENLKSEFIRWLAVLRRLLLELGWRWSTTGCLADANDIFFLEFRELEVRPGHPGGADFRAVVAARRAEYERHLKMTPPSVIIGRFDPDKCLPETVDGQQRVFHGVGVSAGVATGRARVIVRSDADERLQPGEILVAPFTDPGWTPHFLTAAGLVTDLGGILSHGSIVAREYGIPAVVNVGPATRIIRNGQWLEVDANRGRVRVLEEPVPPHHGEPKASFRITP